MRLQSNIYTAVDLLNDRTLMIIPLCGTQNEDLSDFLESLDKLSVGDEIDLKIARKRKKKSLDANAYCWVLIKELSKKLQIPYIECYKHLIREGGEYEVFPLKNEAVESWMKIWSDRGTGWVCDIIGTSKIDGYTNVRSFYGISSYDTKQMARFIDVVIDACKEHGVPTVSAAEIERYKGEWK